jgi:hypothetical protein
VRKVTDVLAGLTLERVGPVQWRAMDSTGRLFQNMNTPADYAEVRASLEREGTG